MPPRREKNEVVLQARALRREMTLPEGMLWQLLRQRPDGFKFRRQHPIGRCIVDFYCPASRLVIELDGEAHSTEDRTERDKRRDRWLHDQGLRVIRFGARDVMIDLQSVVTAILLACRGWLPLHHAPHGSPPHRFAAGRNLLQPSCQRRPGAVGVGLLSVSLAGAFGGRGHEAEVYIHRLKAVGVGAAGNVA
jgi:very-short-patch-repair endonuclease